jgi:hypothetical protein
MILKKKTLLKLEESLWITLTPEQRAILLLWYGPGSEDDYEWEEEDFVHGIRKVQRYYPDHRPKPEPPFFLRIKKPVPGITFDGEPF